MARRAPKVVSHLSDVARLYRGFLFDFDSLSGGDRGFIRAGALRCINELLHREKRVAVVSGTALKASSLAAAAKAGGLPPGVEAWTSGEFVWRSLAATALSQTSSAAALPAAAKTLLPFLDGRPPVRIFELSSIATPRRWSDLAKRDPPPLTDLAATGAVKRVSDVEEADVCYWDMYEGDKLESLLEATLELCVEYRVPLLHVCKSLETARLLSASAPRGSAEAAAASLIRLGGKALSVGKLEACAETLGWAPELSPQDVLLISADVGDVAEASQHSIDSLLLLGGRAESQLAAYASEAAQKKESERRTMSMSQRVHEGTPAALSLHSNPLFSVFKLPELLADATRKSVEHRQRSAAAAAAEAMKSSAASSSASGRSKDRQGASSPASQPLRETPSPREETLELLQRWCAAAGVPAPQITPNALLSWDGGADEPSTRPASLRPTAAKARFEPPGAAEAMEVQAGARRSESRTPGLKSRRTTSSRSRSQEPEAESLEDILKQLKG